MFLICLMAKFWQRLSKLSREFANSKLKINSCTHSQISNTAKNFQYFFYFKVNFSICCWQKCFIIFKAKRWGFRQKCLFFCISLRHTKRSCIIKGKIFLAVAICPISSFSRFFCVCNMKSTFSFPK